MTDNNHNPETNPNPTPPDIPVEGGEMFQGPTITMTLTDQNVNYQRIMSLEKAEELGNDLLMAVTRVRMELAAAEQQEETDGEDRST